MSITGHNFRKNYLILRPEFPEFTCGSKWLQDRRERYDFPELSRQRDPDAIAWEYLNGKYYPLDW